jgi:hypothetical protein
MVSGEHGYKGIVEQVRTGSAAQGHAPTIRRAVDRFDDGLAAGEQCAAVVGGEDGAHPVVDAAEAAWSGLVAIGVGRDKRLHSVGGERLDLRPIPVAGIGEHSFRLCVDARGV